MRAAFLAVLALAGSVRAAPETSFSIFLNVTGWSPFVFYVDKWDMNLDTGAISSANASWVDDGTAFLWIIGTKYVPYGTVLDLEPGLERDPSKISYQWGGSSSVEMLKPYPDVGPIAQPGSIDLGPYWIYIEPQANTTVVIDYITIEIPIVTKA